MMDIGYITSIYVILAIFLSTILDKTLGKFSKKDAAKEGNFIFTLKTIGLLWLVGIIIYLIRNVVELIPSPFNGIAGYEHSRLKELTTAAAFVFVFLLYQKHLKKRLSYMYDMMMAR